MKRAEIIDIIKGIAGIRADSLFTYKEVYTPADFTSNSIPNWGSVQGILPSSDNEVFIISGSPYPTNLILGTDFTANSLRPFVLQIIPGVSDTQDTTNGANLRTDYNFTDNTKTVLNSIDVYTTTDDGTTVNADTWIRII